MSDLRSTCAAQQGTLQELQKAATSTHAAVTAACQELAAQLQSKVSQLCGTDTQLRVQIGMAGANTKRPAITGTITTAYH